MGLYHGDKNKCLSPIKCVRFQIRADPTHLDSNMNQLKPGYTQCNYQLTCSSALASVSAQAYPRS